MWTPTPPGLLPGHAETLFYLFLLYLFSLLYNVSDYHLVNIQTKQYPRPIFGALAAPCPKTQTCLETFVSLSLGIQFLINKESLICDFFSIHLALKLLSCFCCIFRKGLGLLEENYSIFLSLWSTCLFQRKEVFGIEKKSVREDINYTYIFTHSFY